MHSRTIGIVFASGMILAVWTQGRLCIREALIFADQIDHVHSIPTSAPLKPEVHHVMDRCPDFRVFPIQIRLFGREKGEEVLVCLGVVSPLQDIGVSFTSLDCYSIKYRR